MGNAHPDAVAAADEVTASNTDDGVARVLERWWLLASQLGLIGGVNRSSWIGSASLDWRWQLQRDAVDDARHRALLAVEVQRAVLEVLHDPLRLLDLAAGRQAERAALEAQRPHAL